MNNPKRLFEQAVYFVLLWPLAAAGAILTLALMAACFYLLVVGLSIWWSM